MAGSALEKENKETQKNSLSSPSLNVIFHHLQNEFCPKITAAAREFWDAELNFTLVELAEKPNPLWKENDFFVTRIKSGQEADFIIKISDTAADVLLSSSIGRQTSTNSEDTDTLNLKDITELEANILKSFNEFLYKGISDLFLDAKQINSVLHTVNTEKTLYLTFYVYSGSQDMAGRIILLFPQFILKKLVPVQPPEILPDIDLFNNSLVEVDIAVGKTFATLDEIKALELDDIVLLDDSNIHIMYLNSLRGAAINVNPSSQLVISMGNENENWGDYEMTEQQSRNKSIWDSLEVEVEASFEKIKMKLGSLREITEGLVIDVASVANNKIFLDVEGRRIAAGELVIVGDKYGVKITEVLNEEKQAKSSEAQRHAAEQSTKPPVQVNPTPAPIQQNAPEEDGEVGEDLEIEEDFDEEDFELEDEDEEEEEELDDEEEQ